MQPAGLKWLRRYGEARGNEVGRGRRARVLSVGPGDGELDFAFLEGLGAPAAFLGLEPSPRLRADFFARDAAPLPVGTTLALSAAAWPECAGEALEGAYDTVLLNHVLYYFEDCGPPLAAAVAVVAPGGAAVVLVQAAEGVPEIQAEVLPGWRGSDDWRRDVCTADDVEAALRALPCTYERADLDADLDMSAVLDPASDDGVAIMSFCVEADLRGAAPAAVDAVRAAFAKRAVPGLGGGPVLREPVVAFVVRPRE